jgi:dienelactone hydrolase
MRWFILVPMAVVFQMLCVGAWGQELDATLHEEVLKIPKKTRFFTIHLETTIYKPSSQGPFPIAVINHGKAPGDTRFQSRYRPTRAVRFFLQRGYAVVVPMRQGFSKSGGSYIGGGCNVESNGVAQAEDVVAALDFVIQQPWADKERILVAGQSHGGWTTLALGAENYPGVRGLVNFAGGLRQESCPGWERGLARAAAEYGRNSKIPSIWFYGDNDSYFSPYTFKGMFDNYTASGGQAELIAFGVFETDAHSMFGSQRGESIWQPKVEAFMRKVGLPVEVIYPAFGAIQPMTAPAATDFASIHDATALPFVGDKGREGYKTFLTKNYPRAFAISPGGRWAWAEMGDDPLKRALDTCSKNNTQTCRLYAVDDRVVWINE